MERKRHIGTMKLSRVSLLALSSYFLLMLVSCSGEYVGVPRVEVLNYQTAPTYGGLHALATAYGESLNQAVKADTLHPGMYAEYGVTLALMGRTGAACRMLNAEAKAFPESRGMVERIKQKLMPEMLGDTLAAPRDTANLVQLAGWAYDSLTALQPLPYVAPVIDSTDTVWIQQQTPMDSVRIPVELTATEKRELLAKQQAEEALREKAVADSIAAAKQAVIDARKQAKAEREQAKKDKEQARKAEKKARDQQREEERKVRAAERDAAKQAKEEEKKAKEAEKKAQEKAKAEEKKALEKAKEEEKKAKEAEKKALEKAKEEEKKAKEAEKKAQEKAKKEEEKKNKE